LEFPPPLPTRMNRTLVDSVFIIINPPSRGQPPPTAFHHRLSHFLIVKYYPFISLILMFWCKHH
jgi:hypothetical protein